MKGDTMRNIAALFSMLMPGFGQIYNGQFIKGVFFIIVEHFDNAFGHINEAIHLDFNGLHQQAVEVKNIPDLINYHTWTWMYSFITIFALSFFVRMIMKLINKREQSTG